MKKSLLLAICICLLGNIGNVNASGEIPISIEVRGSTTNVLGDRLIYHVKEVIRKSAGYYLTSSNPIDNRLVLTINVIDPYEDVPEQKGYLVIYSTAWAMGYRDNQFCECSLYSSVGYCGTKRVDEAAEYIISQAEQFIDGYWQYIYEFYKTEHQKGDIDSTLNPDSN